MLIVACRQSENCDRPLSFASVPSLYELVVLCGSRSGGCGFGRHLAACRWLNVLDSPQYVLFHVLFLLAMRHRGPQHLKMMLVRVHNQHTSHRTSCTFRIIQRVSGEFRIAAASEESLEHVTWSCPVMNATLLPVTSDMLVTHSTCVLRSVQPHNARLHRALHASLWFVSTPSLCLLADCAVDGSIKFRSTDSGTFLCTVPLSVQLHRIKESMFLSHALTEGLTFVGKMGCSSGATLSEL